MGVMSYKGIRGVLIKGFLEGFVKETPICGEHELSS